MTDGRPGAPGGGYCARAPGRHENPNMGIGKIHPAEKQDFFMLWRNGIQKWCKVV